MNDIYVRYIIPGIPREFFVKLPAQNACALVDEMSLKGRKASVMVRPPTNEELHAKL